MFNGQFGSFETLTLRSIVNVEMIGSVIFI